MRKLLAGLVLSLFAALAVPSLALGTHSNGQGPEKDFMSGAAKGTLVTPCGPRPGHFHTNGQSRDSVTNAATGHFWTTIDIQPPCLGFTSAEFSGDVICMNAYLGPPGEENSGVWRGIVDEVVLNPGNVPGVPGVLAPGTHIFSRHVDNGSPGKDNDRAFGFPTTAGFAGGGCPPLNLSVIPIDQGNLLVHDGI
jgi:hypothetical protein